MSDSAFRFPEGFLWGTAAAGHQVEGGNVHSDWWAWEQVTGHIANGDTSAVACDHWHRYATDFDLAQALHNNSHRLGIEWARIEPRPGEFDDDAIAHYRQVLQALVARGMTPMVTLWHFVLPRWFADQGGWEHPAAAERFVRYVERVVSALRDYCHLWITINEANVYAVFSYQFGHWPPGKRDVRVTFRVLSALVKAHGLAYRAIHRLDPQAQVSVAHSIFRLDPLDPTYTLDRWAAGIQDHLFNRLFIRAVWDGERRFPLSGGPVPEAVRSLDFIGLNYYGRSRIHFDLTSPATLFGRDSLTPGAEINDMGMEVDAHSFYLFLKEFAAYNLPIYITENGISDPHDRVGCRYLLNHLYALWKAMQEGVPVKGYYWWSLMDNFEWDKGYSKRFGLYAVDFATQARTLKRSGELYREIATAHAITPEMVRRYAPELLPPFFPDEPYIPGPQLPVQSLGVVIKPRQLA